MFGNDDDPLFSGMLSALRIAQGIQDFRQRKELFRRQQLRQTAFDAIRNADALHRIMGYSRPVGDDNLVRGRMDAPTRVGAFASLAPPADGIPSVAANNANRYGFLPEMTSVRQADPSRTVDIGSLTGTARRLMEIMTPEEQQAREVGFRREVNRVDLDAFKQRQNIDDESMFNRQKRVLDYEAGLRTQTPGRPTATRTPTTVGAPKEILMPDGKRILRTYMNDGTYKDEPFEGQYVAPPAKSRPPASGSRRTNSGQGRMTLKQRADAMTEKVLAENRGGRIEDAIRNAERFYENDPDMSPAVRSMVLANLRRMKRTRKPGEAGTSTASPAFTGGSNNDPLGVR